MNKKILISLSTIAAVAVVVVGGTAAFFSDTETSNGNIFTAGSIDLKVDHTQQTYNGVDCETCSVDVYSSTSTQVVAGTPNASALVFPTAAVDVASPHPAWQPEAALAPATWIWATDPTTVADTTNGAEYTFENKFQWNGTAVSVDLDLALASDNGYRIILNGTTIVDKLLTETNYASAVPLTPTEETNFMGAMVNGVNTLDIIVRNLPLAANPVTGNPAGLLFKLNVHRAPGECAADSQFQQTCRLWQSTDLTDEQFFNFDDVKPGDQGTNVISLSVTSNDAYACLLLNNKHDNDNGLVDPEEDAGDDSDGPLGEGELSNYLNVVVWDDGLVGDGVHQPAETILYDGLLNSLVPLSLSLPTSTTKYLGLAWCAGDQTVDGTTGVISCDGSGDQNDAQTDSFVADVVAYAVQQRNNENFSCDQVELNQP